MSNGLEHGSMRVARGSASWLSSHGRGLGPRDALKKDSRGLCRGACGPTHVARLEFPHETGLILRCAGKAGNPFQTLLAAHA